MMLKELIVAAVVVAAFGVVVIEHYLSSKKEGMGGYGILSGLHFNNRARRRFKNPYDPPWYPGYEETIGTVVI